MIKLDLVPTYISRDFQQKMEDFATNKKEIAILNAPTGSGKTYGFKKMLTQGFILILLPNNLLSNEVYENFKTDTAVSILNSNAINNEIKYFKNSGYAECTKDDAIKNIITGKKIIISNPEIFYYIMLNNYKNGRSSDSLTDFIINGLKIIIVDEIHIYTRDQLNILLAVLKLINKNIKIMFSSATIPIYIKNLIIELFGECNTEIINVERSYQQNDNVLLQGPISISIPDNHNTANFIEQNIDLLKSGYWFIIADSIRNIDSIYKVIKSHISDDQIALVDAFHDPEYESYMNIFEQGPRIVIGSNIIEQGINPPKKFNNFIIETGLDLKNFIQRFGRIGRNMTSKSNLFIIFKSEIGNKADLAKIKNFEDFITFISKRLPEKERIFNSGYIGVYAALIADKFSINLTKTVKENFLKEEQGTWFTKSFNNTRRTLKIIKQIKEDHSKFNEMRNDIPDLKNIIKWWNKYYESIFRFIPEANKGAGTDIVYDEQFSYDDIWIHKNKNIVMKKNGYYIVNGYNQSPNYQFHVMVSGIPVDDREMKYEDVSPYKARNLILNNINSNFNLDCDGESKKLQEGIKDIIKATGDYERLYLEVKDEL